MRYNELSAQDKIIKAKMQLLNGTNYNRYTNASATYTFFAVIALKFRYHEKKDCPTMAVDKNMNIYYNPDFVNKLKENELMAVIAYEISHYAFGHHGRIGIRDRNISNIAQDYIINRILMQNGFNLPNGCLVTDWSGKLSVGKKILELDNLTWEELYDELIKHAKNMKSDMIGNDVDDSAMTEEEKKEYDEKRKDVLTEASMISRQKGTLSGNIERYIDDLLNPKVHWTVYLNDFITQGMMNGYNYRIPNKRSESVGTFMPKIKRDTIFGYVSLDTSGSMGKEQIKEVLTELYGLFQQYDNLTVKLIQCDSEIHEVVELTHENIDEAIKMAIKGGGGTSHIPVYEYLEEEEEVNFIINLTDGYTDWPEDKEYGFETIWLLTSNSDVTVPFGKTIKL